MAADRERGRAATVASWVIWRRPMSIFPPLGEQNPEALPQPNADLPTGGSPVEGVMGEAGRYAPHVAPERAMDGSLASRPGDPAPAPVSDGAPIFSTDPLG
jgi:hypothetical protein